MRFYKVISRVALVQLALLAGAALGGCSEETVSYSDLLRDERMATNWYLAQHSVEDYAPEKIEDFKVGKDAPFYKMDDDGNVYMQIVNAGDLEDRPQEGDKVLFRFSRRNLKYMYEGASAPVDGNMDNMASAFGSTYFFYKNTTYPTTTQYGTGIQLPMDFVGYYSEVNLVLKSYAGFETDQSQCMPYIVTVKYYKPEY